MRLTYAEIYLKNFEENIKNIKSLLKPETKMCVAVKADSYGNGAVRCAKVCASCGVDFLAIATVSEGIELRENGITLPLLILSLVNPEEIEDLIKYSITPLVFDAEYIKLIDHKAAELGVKEKFPVHIAVDTGMGRIGCLPENAGIIARQIVSTEHLALQGICTHFAVSDSVSPKDIKYTKMQFEEFLKAVKNVEDQGINPGIRHCCNSPATLVNPEMHLDMVRPGIIAYGYYPDQVTKKYLEKKNITCELKPVMALVSGVSAVRDFKKGKSVSYGHTWTAKKDTKIAVVPIGYADGFLRRYNKIVKPVINGKEYSITGRICMDQFMIDLGSETDVKRWDRVVLFGPENSGAKTTCQEIADACGTIPYEIMTCVSKRVERVYI